MKKYHVYGLGNALVDYEYEVEPEFLTKMSVDKGLMVLVDESRQQELVDKLHGIQHKRACGGSAANTCIAMAQLGGKSFYSCKVASDETGQFYYKDLKANNVATNLTSETLNEGVTGKCLVFVTPDADRTMNTHLGISQSFGVSEIVESAIAESEYLYIEGYLVTSPTGKEAAIKAKEIAEKHNVKTAITLSDPGVVEYFKSGFDEVIGDKVDLIFCNEAEACRYTNASNITEAFSALQKKAHQFAITMGSKGALLWDGTKEVDVIAPKVKAIDTNGAGDLFAGSFLYGITHGYSFGEAGKLACAEASELVQSFGARLQADKVKSVFNETL
ncbi:MAG: adenosine kinase [Bacteriovoracaceae bacterium]